MGIKDKAGEMTGKFLKKCVENNGTFLFGTAAAGWFLASASQTIGLLANKNIGKEEKKFLVPQEILDGTFNIATYAAITYPLMKGAELLTKSKCGENNKAIQGAKTIAAILGGVISSNIITPILRNKTSVIVKEKMEAKNLKMPAPEIYDRKTQPNFQACKPFTMNAYLNFTKNMPTNSSLKI